MGRRVDGGYRDHGCFGAIYWDGITIEKWQLMGFWQQVEPQEKKKTPKGRAKKRITYTRRFVNVTLTGGKRKVRIQPPTQ